MIDKVGHGDIDFSEVMIVGRVIKPYTGTRGHSYFEVTFKSGATYTVLTADESREVFIDKWKKSKGQHNA